METPLPRDLLSTSKAARLARCSVKQILRWVATGRLPALKRCGRYFVRRADVRRLFRETVPVRDRPAPLGTSEAQRRYEAACVRLRELGVFR